MSLGKINWGTFKKYTSPQAVKDFDVFLDALPMTVGYNALIAAGLTCLMGAGAVWFASVETQKVSKLHTDLMEVQALQPPVPVLKYVPVPKETLKTLTAKVSATFKGINMVESGDGNVSITAVDTDYFPQFIAAISYLQRGGKNWKVKINTLCVGETCSGAKLAATLHVEIVRFGEPEEKKDVKPDDKAKAVKK